MEKKNVGGITYIKQVPNFLKQMMQLDESGIDGAVRKAEKQPEKQEREDTEDEKPVVVGDAEALPSQQRGKEMKSGGSLRFNGDDDATASSRFRESARERVLQAEREAFAVADESDAAQASGKVVFNAAVQKKRKHVDGTASSSKGVGVGAAKAVKNTKLLSFDAEDCT